MTRQQFAELALSLPETSEKSHFAQPDFRVCGKIFCGLGRAGERGYLKLPKEQQALVTEARPNAFSAAEGAWGGSGWTYVLLPRVSLAELSELLTEAWRQVAPRRLAAALPPSSVVVSEQRAPAPKPARTSQRAARNSRRRPRSGPT